MRRIAPRVLLCDAAQVRPTASTGELVLACRASAAFGDGSHPTTRLCAGAVDVLCRTRQPSSLLDVGTGTGVLARIAHGRGVARVVGVDNDDDAVATARDNAGFDDGGDRIAFLNAPPPAWGSGYDLVVANILQGVLVALAADIVRATADDGVVLLSGFTPPQSPALRAAYAAHGFTRVVEAHLEGWVLLQLSR